MTKVFCEVCHGVFNEEMESERCPHVKKSDVVLAVRADGKSSVLPKQEVVKYIAAKDPGGTRAELRLVVQRQDGVVPDRIELQHGTVFTTVTGQLFKVHVPWLTRLRVWLLRLFRRGE